MNPREISIHPTHRTVFTREMLLFIAPFSAGDRGRVPIWRGRVSRWLDSFVAVIYGRCS
jgi:hypothetical protein